MLRTKNILHYDKKYMGDPCGKYITDKEFLMHMIPHHQVAVDMSKEVMKYTTDPSIVYLARNIIFKQSDEILFMENVLLSSTPNLSSKDKSVFIEIPNQFTIYYPKESRADDFQCSLHHFSSKIAKKHKLKEGQILSDEEFMRNMIYHHDVAIEMSNRIVKYSKNPNLISFAYEIIKNQRYEIWLMKNYLKYNKPIYSKILKEKAKYQIIEGFNSKYKIIFSKMILILFICIGILYLKNHKNV
jgi:uncharacterized protein (DUF305 family)